MAWRDIALRHTHRAVHVIRTILIQTMEVSACAFVSELDLVSTLSTENGSNAYRIVQIDDHPVALGEVE